MLTLAVRHMLAAAAKWRFHRKLVSDISSEKRNDAAPLRNGRITCGKVSPPKRGICGGGSEMPYQVLHYKGNELISAKTLKEKTRADKELERLKTQHPNDDISIRPLYTLNNGIKAG